MLSSYHRFLTSLLVSSIDEGRLVDSLNFLVNPLFLNEQEFLSLNDSLKSMTLFGVPYESGFIWTNTKYKKMLQKFSCSSRNHRYAISGLASFPLRNYPFYHVANVMLNPFLHIQEYISCYHKYSVEVLSCSEQHIHLKENQDEFIVSYENKQFILILLLDRSLEISALINNSSSSLSCSIFRYCRASSGKLFTQRKLDSLQYPKDAEGVLTECCFNNGNLSILNLLNKHDEESIGSLRKLEFSVKSAIQDHKSPVDTFKALISQIK